MASEVPQEWKDATIKVIYNKKDWTESMVTTGASLWWRMLPRFSSNCNHSTWRRLRRRCDSSRETVWYPASTLDNL